MASTERNHHHRMNAVRRHGDQVTPLELFFDLVFVLAITQCTALMTHHPTWGGVGRAMLVLSILWWAWVGYSWLTSVVDPEEGASRLVVFGAMAAMLVAALAVPHAFGDDALKFGVAYAVVRLAHITLFMLASRDDPNLRRSVVPHGASSALCSGLIIAGSFLDTNGQTAVWIVALALDLAEPYFIGISGWQLVPGHFAERHGLIIIVALGESIVALGVAADTGLHGGEIVAVTLGVALSGAMWWAYFDHVAIASVRRLEEATSGHDQNALARDGYSYLHLPLVAGIVLVAFAMHETLAHVSEPLPTVPAFGLAGGTALYLLGHVAFRYRAFHSVKWGRLLAAVVALALVPVATEVDAVVALALVTGVIWAVVSYESVRYADARAAIRHARTEVTA
jgi:low temperature requirement protein LtrA